MAQGKATSINHFYNLGKIGCFIRGALGLARYNISKVPYELCFVRERDKEYTVCSVQRNAWVVTGVLLTTY
eukprot:3639490-Pleurochrysis_carterae.AAC.1